MQVNEIKNFIGGWFIGNFSPSLHQTQDFEVAYHSYHQGQIWPDHFHKIAREIVYVISGTMKINGTTVTKGNLFILEPNEISRSEYLTDCELLIVKTPSVPGDKYLI
jgi:quercetin dioxygenase-like cupin family protein